MLHNSNQRGGLLREETFANIAAVIALLREGKTPKEIAYHLNMGWSAVKMIIQRFPDVRTAFIETYTLRYPDKSTPPHRIVEPLRRFSNIL